jgi:hypothetical protein
MRNMRTKPIFRLYRIQMRFFSHSYWLYYDTKYSFLRNLEFFKEQNKDVVGYKFVRGEYQPIV